MSKTEIYVPKKGEDAEFDGIIDKVMEALKASGNPEGITEDAARKTIAEKMAKHGGKEFTRSRRFAGDDLEDERPTEDSLHEEAPEIAGALRIPTAGEPYWYEDDTQARLIDHYILSRRALGTKFHGALLIVGPAGTGKTMGVAHAIARINRQHNLSINLLKMDCATITDTQKWLGRREIDETGTTFHESDFLKAVQRGDGILLDEITRLHPHLTNIVMSLLDGSQSLHLSDMNVTIPVHPETFFIATANIGVQFGGTHRMDWAMRERFPFTIERDFPPKAEEIKVLTTATNVDPDAASILVDIAAKTRAMYDTGDLRSAISTRTLVSAAWLVASGMTEREALEFTAIPLFDKSANGMVGDESERMKVTGAIEGKVGRA